MNASRLARALAELACSCYRASSATAQRGWVHSSVGEQLTLNQRAVGSSPTAPTNLFKELWGEAARATSAIARGFTGASSMPGHPVCRILFSTTFHPVPIAADQAETPTTTASSDEIAEALAFALKD